MKNDTLLKQHVRQMLIIPIKKIILFTTLSSAFLSLSAFAGLNKWVDEAGQTHYGDRVPAQYLKKQHHLLNEQGLTLRTSDAKKSDEELNELEKARKAKAEKSKQLLIATRKKALRDRVLLDTFTTEKDLMIARDERIDAIDSQISLAETLITHDEKKLASAKERIATIEKTGRKAPENVYKEVTSVSRQIENNFAYIEDKTNERDEMLKTFKEDVLRFRQLKQAKKEAQERNKNQ